MLAALICNLETVVVVPPGAPSGGGPAGGPDAYDRDFLPDLDHTRRQRDERDIVEVLLVLARFLE